MRKIIETNSIIDRYIHGYYTAKKHFNGKLKREVLVTLYDIREKVSTFGYLYLCEGNVLLFLQKFKKETNVLYEIEQADNFFIKEANEKDLKELLNASPQVEKNLNTGMVNPLKYLVINNEYLLLCDIQADLQYGEKKLDLTTIFFTGKDETEKIENLVLLIIEIINKSKTDWGKNLPGIEARLALFNIYAVTVGFGLAIVFLLIIPWLVDIRIAALVWIITLIIFLGIWKKKA